MRPRVRCTRLGSDSSYIYLVVCIYCPSAAWAERRTVIIIMCGVRWSEAKHSLMLCFYCIGTHYWRAITFRWPSYLRIRSKIKELDGSVSTFIVIKPTADSGLNCLAVFVSSDSSLSSLKIIYLSLIMNLNAVLYRYL